MPCALDLIVAPRVLRALDSEDDLFIGSARG